MGEPSLSGRTEGLRDAFGALARSLKRISIYRHARDQHASYLEPALVAMRSLLARGGSFTVDVHAAALLFAGEPVYAEVPREGGLCFRLHRDGVRKLTFSRGLGSADLLVLCEVALFEPQSAGPSREDAVTELWKADLAGLSWTAVSGYRMERNQAEAPLVAAQVEAASSRVRAVLARATTSGRTFADDATFDSRPLFTDLQRAAADPDRWTDLAQRAALTVLRIVEQGYAGRDLEALQDSTLRLLEELVGRGEALGLARALDAIRQLGGPQAGDFRIALGRNLADPQRLSALVQLCGKDERAVAQALPFWLTLLARDSAAVLLELLAAAPQAAQQTIARAIVDRAESNRNKFEETLRSGRAEVVLPLLAALGASPLAARATFAACALRHHETAVRLEAAALVGRDQSAAVTHLGPLLSGPDATVRMAAAGALGRAGIEAEAAAELFIASIERPAFAEGLREEQTFFYRALGRIESTRGFDFLCDQLAVRRGLFRKKAATATRLLAVQGLSEDRTPRSLRILEEAASPSGAQPPLVASAARAAAARLRAAGARGAPK